jgi:hypothetical protein
MIRQEKPIAKQRLTDKEEINNQLDGFNPRESTFVREFMTFFSMPNHQVVLKIAALIAEAAGLEKFNRLQKKSKKLALRWIHDNWSFVKPRMEEFYLFAINGRRVSKNGDSFEV